MSYGEIYRLEYRDQLLEGEDGRLTTVKIKRKDYSGDYTELKGSGDPVQINASTDDDYMFSQICASSCKLNLLSEESFQFIDIFSANARQHLVEIWKEETPLSDTLDKANFTRWEASGDSTFPNFPERITIGKAGTAVSAVNEGNKLRAIITDIVSQVRLSFTNNSFIAAGTYTLNITIDSATGDSDLVVGSTITPLSVGLNSIEFTITETGDIPAQTA